MQKHNDGRTSLAHELAVDLVSIRSFSTWRRDVFDARASTRAQTNKLPGQICPRTPIQHILIREFKTKQNVRFVNICVGGVGRARASEARARAPAYRQRCVRNARIAFWIPEQILVLIGARL